MKFLDRLLVSTRNNFRLLSGATLYVAKCKSDMTFYECPTDMSLISLRFMFLCGKPEETYGLGIEVFHCGLLLGVERLKP